MAANGGAEVGQVNHTLYVHNIDEKIKKEVLKKSLHSCFGRYGRILSLVARRGNKLRGQAWVVFEEQSSAMAALKDMQGFNFYGKPLDVQFAHHKSDKTARRDGTYAKEKKRREERKKEAEAEAAAAEKSNPSSAAPPAAAAPTPAGLLPPAASQAPPPVAPAVNLPNRILFAQNLPPECTESMLAVLFSQHNGYKEVRMVEGKAGIAFIEFADQMQATVALQTLNRFLLSPNVHLELSYAAA